jgi:hypothetical protein
VTDSFFTAKVTPLPHDPRQPDRQNTYWRALRTLPDFEIIEGDFRTRKVRAKVVNPPPNTIKIYKNGFTWNQLLTAQFANPLSDSHGTFSKPATW